MSREIRDMLCNERKSHHYLNQLGEVFPFLNIEIHAIAII